jgi:hypothetical protein
MDTNAIARNHAKAVTIPSAIPRAVQIIEAFSLT